jgi:hypothetical protein
VSVVNKMKLKNTKKTGAEMKYIGGICRVNGCSLPAAHLVFRGRFKALVCEKHHTEELIIKPVEFNVATTGFKECDSDIDRAVDAALLRLKPILRDVLRSELKNICNLRR